VTSAKLASDIASLGKVSNGAITGNGTNINIFQPLTANGLIESLTGGFKFPDGTTQTTAATPSGGADALLICDSNGQIVYQKNVQSVQRFTQGSYLITFQNPLKNNNYLALGNIQVTGGCSRFNKCCRKDNIERSYPNLYLYTLIPLLGGKGSGL